jgi:hypothetical protein
VAFDKKNLASLQTLIYEVLLKEFSLIDTMFTGDRKSNNDRSNREPIIKQGKFSVSDVDNENIASHLTDDNEDMDNFGPVPPTGDDPYYMIQDPYANDSTVLPRKAQSSRG